MASTASFVSSSLYACLVSVSFVNVLVCVFFFVLIIDNSEFTQQDGRKKMMAKHLRVTNVTRLLLACSAL